MGKFIIVFKIILILHTLFAISIVGGVTFYIWDSLSGGILVYSYIALSFVIVMLFEVLGDIWNLR